MSLPKLDPSNRDREYKQRNFEEISQIVHTWLFNNDVGHREMDRDILGLDPLSSKGWQSMGVLHYLGLKKEFKGIFQNSDLNQAISNLKSDEQDFSFIIELLENTSERNRDMDIHQIQKRDRYKKDAYCEYYC